jgi:hypothetical protein
VAPETGAAGRCSLSASVAGHVDLPPRGHFYFRRLLYARPRERVKTRFADDLEVTVERGAARTDVVPAHRTLHDLTFRAAEQSAVDARGRWRLAIVAQHEMTVADAWTLKHVRSDRDRNRGLEVRAARTCGRSVYCNSSTRLVPSFGDARCRPARVRHTAASRDSRRSPDIC